MPNNQFFRPLNINPWSWNSLGSKILISGDDSISDCVSLAYPSANMAIYVPFFLQQPMVVDRVFWGNGSVLSGNVDAGIYDANGVRLASSGSTAQAAASDVQSVNITNVTLGTGLFFLALACDNTTAQFMALNTFASLGFYKTLGCYQQASAFPLPATATFGTPTANFLPLVGATPRSFV